MSALMAMTRFMAVLLALVIVSDSDVLWAQVGNTEHYFAQAAVGPSVKTTIHLHNPNTEEITVVWKMYGASSGTNFSVFDSGSVALPGSGANEVELSSSDGSLVVGWLKLESTHNFIATEIFDLTSALGSDILGVLPSKLSTEIRCFGEISTEMLTGMAIVNPSPVATSTVTVRLLDKTGLLKDSRSFSLDPLSHLARYLNEDPLFDDLGMFEGTVKVTSTLPFICVAIIQRGQQLMAVAVEEITVTTPQLGLNFIRFFWGSEEHFQPGWILEDFGRLGVQAYRQLIKGDVLWNVVENQDNEWDFSGIDQVITPGIEAILTLFSIQYASPTPPWAQSPAEFQKTVGIEAQDYVETVVRRYADKVKYWELGNEMDHWRAADPGSEGSNLPPYAPEEGFTPQEQGVFLSQVAQIIRENDRDAVIILPGMGGIGDYTIDTWFPGVIEGGGSEWFDVVNYHFYGPWVQYIPLRNNLTQFLKENGLHSKPVWLTETGVTSSPTLTLRTDYPNNPEAQAADVFRRIVQAWGHGDQFVAWHTYISSPDISTNDWRLYGVRRDSSAKQLSYYALELLGEHLVPLKSIEKMSGGLSDPAHAYKIEKHSGEMRYVFWGSENYTLPSGITECVSVIPDAEGQFSWNPVQAESSIVLEGNPVMCK